MKKYIYITIGVAIVIALGFIIPPPNGLFRGAIDTISPDKVATLYNQSAEIKSKYQLSEVSLIKTEIKNQELDKYTGEPKDEIKITIGDNEPIPVGFFGAGEQEFKPNITLERWREVSFSIKTDNLLKDVATKDKKLSFDKDRIKFETPKMSFEMYSVDEGEGSYKYIWQLNEDPRPTKTGNYKVEFQIESEGLDFFYQPALTEEYQNGYSEEFQKEIVVTETQVKDLEGNVLVERPENVVGSYAVYHSTKGGMNDINGKDYKTGQFGFIYKSKIVDAEGKQTWAILKIDAEKGIYYEEIPQDFLDKAIYPIKGNQNFGYETKGSSSYFMSGVVTVGQFTGVAGTGVSMTCYQHAFGSSYLGNYKYGIYGISGDSYTTLITNGETNSGTTSATATWYTRTFPTAPTFTAIPYGLGFMYANYTYLYYNTTGGNSGEDAATWPTWPTNGALDLAYKYSIYATYTPAAPPAVAEDPPQVIVVD